MAQQISRRNEQSAAIEKSSSDSRITGKMAILPASVATHRMQFAFDLGRGGDAHPSVETHFAKTRRLHRPTHFKGG